MAQLPDVRISNGVVNMRYRRGALAAVTTRAAEVALERLRPVDDRCRRRPDRPQRFAARRPLERLEVNGGANHIDLELPPPVGTTIIRVSGVISDAHFRRPRGVSVRLRVDGGISHLNFDGKRYKDVDGERRFTSDGSGAIADGYEIDIRDGASSLRISS